MKKIVYLISVILMITSCTKKESIIYGEMDSLQFAGRNNFNAVYNFATKFDPASPSWDRYFYGDSLASDTLIYYVDLLGVPSPDNREYYLTTVTPEGQDPQNVAQIDFLNPYVLDANQTRDTVKIIIRRPKTRGVFPTAVTFDFEKMRGSFGRGVAEQLEIGLEISDSYTEPVGWNVRYFGEYSEEKYAFFVSVLHIEYVSWMEWMFEYFKQTLKARLNQFNEEHPDNPKEFTFPE